LLSVDSNATLIVHIVDMWQMVNPFNASCSKLLLFEGFSAILV